MELREDTNIFKEYPYSPPILMPNSQIMTFALALEKGNG